MNRTQLVISATALFGVLLINESYSQQYYGVHSYGGYDSCGYYFIPANNSEFGQYRSRTAYYGQDYGGLNVYQINRSIDCPREIEFANRAYGINPTGFDQFDSMAPIRSQSLGDDFGCPDCDQRLNGFGQAFQGRQQNNSSFPPRPNLGRDFADQQPRLQTPLTPSLQSKGFPQPKEKLPSNSTKLIPPPQLPPQISPSVPPQTDYPNGVRRPN